MDRPVHLPYIFEMVVQTTSMVVSMQVQQPHYHVRSARRRANSLDTVREYSRRPKAVGKAVWLGP